MPGADLDERLDRLLRGVQDGVTAGDPTAVARRGRRRRLGRRTAGVGAVAALLAAVVVVAALLPDRVPRPAAVATGPAVDGVPNGAAPWFDAHLSGDPGVLVVSVTAPVGARSRPSDPCWEGYQPQARAEPDRMVVTIRRLRPRAPAPEGHSCTTVGLLLSLTVPLPEDLHGRPLVDGATGQRRPLVERLLTPGWLPDNWFVQMMYPTGRGERWRRVYHQGGGVRAGRGPWRVVELPPGPAERVTVVAIPPRLLGSWNRWPDTPVVGHTQVRGRRAVIDADPRRRIVSVRWREGEVAYVVTGHGRQGAKLRQVQELVVRIAQSLR